MENSLGARLATLAARVARLRWLPYVSVLAYAIPLVVRCLRVFRAPSNDFVTYVPDDAYYYAELQDTSPVDSGGHSTAI